MQTKRRISKWWWTAAAGLLLVFVLSRGCRKDNAVRVAVEKIKRQTITETVDGSGKINPVNEMKISAEAGSLVTEIYVKEGDTVRRGQVVAVVRTGQTTTTAGAASPKPDLQKMMASGNINPAAIAEAMQNSRPAAPIISTRQVNQNITAPMNGIISSIQVKKGERLMGTEIARISSAGEWEIRTDVGEVDIVKIKEGNLAEIEPDAFPGAKLTGTVYRITSGGTLSGNGLPGNIYSDLTAYRVYIRVDAASLNRLKDSLTGEARLLRSGMNTSVSISTRTRSNIWAVPIKAVTTRLAGSPGEKEGAGSKNKRQRAETVVFVVKDNIVIQKKVTTGIQDMNDIEITSGLSGDESIVTDPFEVVDKILADGMKVKVTDKMQLFNKK
jgi:HlyD family secretion protein